MGREKLFLNADYIKLLPLPASLSSASTSEEEEEQEEITWPDEKGSRAAETFTFEYPRGVNK